MQLSFHKAQWLCFSLFPPGPASSPITGHSSFGLHSLGLLSSLHLSSLSFKQLRHRQNAPYPGPQASVLPPWKGAVGFYHFNSLGEAHSLLNTGFMLSFNHFNPCVQKCEHLHSVGRQSSRMFHFAHLVLKHIRQSISQPWS